MNELLRQIINEKLIPLRNTDKPPTAPFKPTVRMIQLNDQYKAAVKAQSKAKAALEKIGASASSNGMPTQNYQATRKGQTRYQNQRAEKIEKLQSLRLQAEIDLIGMTKKDMQGYFRDLRIAVAAIARF